MTLLKFSRLRPLTNRTVHPWGSEGVEPFAWFEGKEVGALDRNAQMQLNFAAGEFQIKGQPLLLCSGSDHSGPDDTGLEVWDGAVALAKYLEANEDLIRGRGVIELGAGTGLVALE